MRAFHDRRRTVRSGWAPLLVLVAALAATGCGGDDDDGAQSKGAAAQPAGVRAFTYGHGADPSEADRVVEIQLLDPSRIAPEAVEVKSGEVVTFHVVNKGTQVHELTLGGPNAQDLHEAQMVAMGGSMPGMATTSTSMGAMGMTGTTMPSMNMSGTSAGSMDGTTTTMAMKTPAAGTPEGKKIAALDKKAAAFESVHVMPGDFKDFTWAFTGDAPLLGCHLPGHWKAGMRGKVRFT